MRPRPRRRHLNGADPHRRSGRRPATYIGRRGQPMWHADRMQAVSVPEPGGPGQLILSDRPVPVPRADEVLIRVVAAGINRADLLQRQGHYPPPPGASDVLGMECSGYVTALGSDAADGRWTVGDPCLALLSSGGYAEYVAVPVGQLLSVPA